MTIVNLEELDFELPDQLIAQRPAASRDESRLLVVERSQQSVTEHRFKDLPDLLDQTTHFFRNRIRVRKARLNGTRPTGGKAEILLLNPLEDGTWEALARPTKKLPPGTILSLDNTANAEVVAHHDEGVIRIRINPGSHGSDEAMAEALGKVPLPPYIHRDKNNPATSEDEIWYQTVYNQAVKPLAAAAPTAGLHFTPDLIQQLEASGHRFFDLDLCVGLGTFRPIQTQQVEHHPIHSERYWIPQKTWQAAQPGNARRLAVGTTSLRALEDAARSSPSGGYPKDLNEISRDADIFIYPPASFSCTDALITNFHLPRSSLLCLVAAFLSPNSNNGLPWLKEIYARAVSEQFRFFSYGDAMLIL